MSDGRSRRPYDPEGETMQVQAYLSFEGRCEEALEFYKKALGAEVTFLMRMKDSPEPPPGGLQPAMADKVLHSELRVGNTTLMASDGMCQGKANFEGIALAIQAQTDAQAERLFAALADGGRVQQPLIKTFFSSRFGMLADRFGVQWMLVVTPQEAKA
jgi:PhnB protein